TAYQNALSYVRDRKQGRDVAGRKKDADVPIIDHPDIRRMLIWMKAMVDGMRSMIYTGAFWSDLALEMPDGEKKSYYMDLVDFMTPIIKAYCSDMGFKVCETAMQCLGGYGFCKDYPIEQYLRDAKIMSLYEGTNGIQSMDLMGRKLTIKDGACLKAFKNEIDTFCHTHREHPELGAQIRTLAGVAARLWEATDEMNARRKNDVLQWASYTYPALLAFGEVTVSWRLLDMAVIAYEDSLKTGKKYDFHRGKVMQASFFVDTTLPHTLAHIDTCLRNGREVLNIPDAGF
ncbi:acyl-CoA dehydrogenase, partial [Desulfosarcina sp. OttesenSCG-928-A07]|nr:acyl-CoA dehydrogenase [Desulfosarcina sp. OttesenSCG-928-A07]